MPVPFHESEEADSLGAAGFLTFETLSGGAEIRGALLLINARGEPLEFVANRISGRHAFLWRQDDLRRSAQGRLATSLFAACTSTPHLILCPVGAVCGDLFREQIRVSIPLAYVAPIAGAGGEAQEPCLETSEELGSAQVFWSSGGPATDSTERRLCDWLGRRGLLLEPFERAAAGLREVYGAQPGTEGLT